MPAFGELNREFIRIKLEILIDDCCVIPFFIEYLIGVNWRNSLRTPTKSGVCREIVVTSIFFHFFCCNGTGDFSQ